MGRIFVIAAAGLLFAGTAQAQGSKHFSAHLDGFNLAGVPVDTNATGQAQFEVLDDGTAVRFSVNIAGIRNLFMAHIHISPVPVTVNDLAGPIAFWFVPTTPPTAPAPGVNVAERLQGSLTEGIIMWDEQLQGPLAPNPMDPDGTGISGLIRAMEEGRASVIVHTNAFGDPDFPLGTAGNSPPGELRGTIE